MRIIAGAKRGMKLLSPGTGLSRPITDRVKESLFSVLYKYGLPGGKRVADLFCGVGSMGLESLSRGAGHVIFVEKDAKIVATLKKNIERSGFGEESQVVRADVFKRGIADEQGSYDLIFVDPPYADTKDIGVDSALSGLLTCVSRQLAQNGIVVVRTHQKTELLDEYGPLQTVERRTWGTMALSILRKKVR